MPLLQEVPCCVLQEEEVVPALGVGAGVEVVLQGHGALQGADDVDALALGAADPVREVQGVWDGGAQHDDVHVVGQQDQDLEGRNLIVKFSYIVVRIVMHLYGHKRVQCPPFSNFCITSPVHLTFSL